jgi:hypothetical protein
VVGHKVRLLLTGFARSDIGGRARHQVANSPTVAQSQPARGEPAVATIGAAHPVLAIEMRGLSLEMLGDGQVVAVSVIVVNQRQPRISVGDPVIGIAQHGQQTRADVELLGNGVPGPQPVMRLARGQIMGAIGHIDVPRFDENQR